ncbi:unnamed protein product [Ambrosiozyma monospora]|uniref:Unnamed protein product n=1 Tax=Ambrosiozyma monospora TaxID=43982 RepID=A0A9W6T7K2_AMBMO|nr:unnamed protein product [Ambrosiozyma monospora]
MTSGEEKKEWIGVLKKRVDVLESKAEYDPDEEIVVTLAGGDSGVGVSGTDAGAVVKRNGEKKVRVCARGDQQPSSSYDDSYFPTLRTDLLKLILANAVRKQHHIEFLDITAAYLNADLPSDTELYIPPPTMKIIKTKLNPNQRVVYRLKKALFDLRSSGLLWFQVLKRFLDWVSKEEMIYHVF